MRTKEEINVLRERAVELRLAGKSLREIKEIIGPMSNTTLHDALKGTPSPAWTRRPNAKDDVQAQARELRGQGLAYHEIAARLGVSKSSVSLWVRDLPVPERLTYGECRKRAADGAQRYWAIERAARKPGALVRCRPRRTRWGNSATAKSSSPERSPTSAKARRPSHPAISTEWFSSTATPR
jgi:transposase